MELVVPITVIHILACLSPGPDIFLVIRTSLRHGWQQAVWTTSGILTGVFLQIALGLTGVTYLISRNATLVQALTLAGGCWLIYLGSGIFAKSRTEGSPGDPSTEALQAATPRSGWLQGLLINLSNPKALLYFFSLFTVMLGPEVSIRIRILGGLSMLVAQATAFTLVAGVAAHPFFTKRWPVLQTWLDKGISLILLGLGIWIWIRFARSLMT